MRHGKHAGSSSQQQTQQPAQTSQSRSRQTAQPAASTPAYAQPAAQQAQYNTDMPTQGLAAGGNAYNNGQAQNGSSKVPQASPNYREEAERIVADERAQNEKMPVYDVSLAIFCRDCTDACRDWKTSDL